jgi:small subunit ribosomal protein S16
MVRIRLRKVGSKAQQSFRIVTADREHPRDGRFLENLGYYNPRTHPATITLDEARAYHWLKNGAQPSESVAQLFKVTGTLDRYARFKAGEAVETLLAEAKEAETLRNVSHRTSDAKSIKDKPSKRQQKKAQAGDKEEKPAA